MRIYADCYELMSEIFREVWEMGHIVHPFSMQNKVVKGDVLYSTKEIINYNYCLTAMNKKDFLFWADKRSKLWVELEFEERVSKKYENPGRAWKIREDLWLPLLNERGEFDYSYNERIQKSIEKVIYELRNNPDTRQAIIAIWEPTDIYGLGGTYRVPCSIYYQFFYRENMLHIQYNQRSADVVTHFGNDVYLAWRLMEYIAEQCNYRPGYLFHNIGSLHAYRKDWEILKSTMKELITFKT